MRKSLIICLSLCFSTCNLFAQCFPDRHNTNAFDAWISCEDAASPNLQDAAGKWVQLDFLDSYQIFDLQIWNQNHPELTDMGVKDIKLDLSLDGDSWTTVDTITIPRASARSRYEGHMVYDFAGQQARFLLISVLSNYGASCASMAEIKVFTEDQLIEEFNLGLELCENEGPLRNLSSGISTPGSYMGPGVTDNGDGSFDFDPDALGPGTYTVSYFTSVNVYDDQIVILPCYDDRCGDCPECGELDQALLDQIPIPEDIYQSDSISAMGLTAANESVEFRSSHLVELSNGFEVELGSDFTAAIRACQLNQMENFGFEDEDTLTNWVEIVHSDIRGESYHTITTDALSGSYASHSYLSRLIYGTNGRVNTGSLQLHQRDKTIIAGETYELSFWAKSDAVRMLELSFKGSGITYVKDYLRLTDQWRHFTYRFTAEDTVENNVDLRFIMGREVGHYYLDHVRLVTLD